MDLGHGVIQYEQNYAWMEGDNTVILRSDKKPAHAIYDRNRRKLTVINRPLEADLIEQRALGHVLLPSILYSEQDYHLPSK